MEKNFRVFIGWESGKNVYRVLASERISKIRGSEIIATCYTYDDAEWLCGVLECYWLLTNKISNSIFGIIRSNSNNDER